MARKIAVILLMVLAIGSAQSQPSTNKWNITGELGLLSARANPKFRSYMNGLINAHPKLQYNFKNNMYVAFGPKYMYFQVSEFKVPVKMTGGAHVYGGDVELGYTSWRSERFAIEGGFRFGVAHHQFVTSETRKTGIPSLNSAYYEPTVSFILRSDEAVAYRWMVGYNIDGYDFRNELIGLNANGGLEERYHKASQSLIIGFAISYYFGNPRSDTDLDEITRDAYE